MSEKHGLSKGFMDDLKEGRLLPILRKVKLDHSLLLEIRAECINIYYRGGSLLRLKAYRDGYDATVGEAYLKSRQERKRLPRKVMNHEDVDIWLNAVPALKSGVDAHRYPEREMDQLILRDNNYGSVANATDYYFCDFEYDTGKGILDLVGVHWPSKRNERQRTTGRRLVIAEVKHGDGALNGKCGISAHVEDIDHFLSDAARVRRFKEDMVGLFKQKHRLGLIRSRNELDSFSDDKPLLLLVLVNHDPETTALGKILKAGLTRDHADIAFATSSFMGFGLFDQAIVKLEDLESNWSKYVHSV